MSIDQMENLQRITSLETSSDKSTKIQHVMLEHKKSKYYLKTSS